MHIVTFTCTISRSDHWSYKRINTKYFHVILVQKFLGVCRQTNALSTYSNDANRNTDHNTVKSRKSYIPATKKGQDDLDAKLVAQLFEII